MLILALIPEKLLTDLTRCDRELREITQRADIDSAPAILSAMGQLDWLYERQLIEAELAALQQQHKEDHL